MAGMKHCILLAGLFAIGTLLPGVARAAEGGLKVVTDFEGASAIVTDVDQATKTIRFRPAGDAARGWPCWWYFRVEGIVPGETLTLELSPSESLFPVGNKTGKTLAGSWASPDLASWSTDGKTWKQTGAGQRAGGVTTYRQQVDAPVAWFAWGPPFTPSDSAALVERLGKESTAVEPFTLCQSRGGRPCPAMRIREGELPDAKRPAVWIEARQHAWESGSSWVCRGVAEWLASDDPQAKSLRQRADIYIVPIMDIDNTATGNGGKSGIPQDHNRDWTDQPHWPEVAAAQKRLKALADEGRLAIFLDLHNPAPGDKRPFFFIPPDELVDEVGRANRDRFLTIAALEITGPLKLSDRPRTSGSNYDRQWQQISKNWVSAHCSPQAVSATLETSWNTPHSTTEGYRTVGRQLGQAIERYLR